MYSNVTNLYSNVPTDIQLKNEYDNQIYAEITEAEYEELENIRQNLKFVNLTGPSKMKILHSRINFQGFETSSFFELVGNDFDTLNLIPSNDLKVFLMESKKFKIGEIIKTCSKPFHIERKFVLQKYSEIDEKYDSSIKEFKQIVAEVNFQKTFLLLDSNGTGKSMTFECIARKLKETFTNSWVLLLKLKKYSETLEKFSNLHCELALDEVINILQACAGLRTEYEAKILTKMLTSGRAILLVDEIDEISPNLIEFALDILGTYRKTTKNQLWITTDQKYCKQMEELFDVSAYKFVPMSWNEKREFILEILTKLKVIEPKSQLQAIEDLNRVFNKYGSTRDLTHLVNNLLIIEIITELYVDEKFSFCMDSIKLFAIFDKFIRKRWKKVEIKNFDRETLSFFSLSNVHQVFALNLLIGNYYNDKYGVGLEHLSIMKQWEGEKYKWTFEKIYRFGILTVDFDDPKSNMNSMNFINIIFAEFFLADFIISYLCHVKPPANNDEFKKIFNILKITLREVQNFEFVRYFLFSYITDKPRTRAPTPLNEMILKNIFHIHKEILESVYITGSLLLLKNWSTFLRNEHQLLKLLWHVGKNQNIIKKLVCQGNVKNRLDIQEFLELTQSFFGSNWHMVFNKSRIPLITDEDIGNIEEDENIKCIGLNRNLLKFIDLIERNYENEQNQYIYKEFFSYYKVVPFVKFEVLMKILSKCYHIFKDNTEDFIQILIRFLKHSTDLKVLRFIGGKLEILLNQDERSIRKVLFTTYHSNYHPLVISLRSQNLKLFYAFRNVYSKYKIIWKEIQDILTSPDVLPGILVAMTNEIYPHFREFIHRAFNRNEEKLVDIMENYLIRTKPEDMKNLNMKFVELFIKHIFADGTHKMSNTFKKFLNIEKVGIYENFVIFGEMKDLNENTIN